MKLMHLSDLHLGKRVNGFSMIPDQKHILSQILTILEEERPDALLIAGDVYDKTVPSAEAVELLDDFLSRSAAVCDIFLIAGNHDSAERLAFGGQLFARTGVYVSPVYDGTITAVEKSDEHGSVVFHLLPFLKPAHVRPRFPEATIESYSDAIRTALSGIDLHDGKRHVLLAHQLVTGSERCESEELSIGGSDNVDAEVFDGFAYVALGHLHGPQRAGADHIRYCGTPLKYSFSEEQHRKSVTLVELGSDSIRIDTRPLAPLRDLKTIRGTYAQVTAREFYLNTDYPDSYLHMVLTDEEDIPEALGRLRSVYPYIMKLTYDNTRTRLRQNPMELEARPEQSPMELFGELYSIQNNRSLSPEQTDYLQGLIDEIWEGQP